MIDYYALISKAVENLQGPHARRLVYERGRKALLDELNAVWPRLRQSVVTEQLVAFDDAVGKTESEIADRAHGSE